MKSKDILSELKWRGLVAQTTDETLLSDVLNSGTVKYYCGFDPTAPSLHHGNLVQLILMKHLQNAGNQPFCVIGGATGLIGDPRQSGERVLNDKETVATWAAHLSEQFKRYLDFDGPNAAQVVNNYDWTSSLSAIDFLRDIGKNFRLGTMLAKDTVKKRLDSPEGLSFTEFSYQVLQGFDYLQLFENYGVTLQTGGSDQWGNLTSGLDLIHKTHGETVHVMTTPLITKVDGTKFGKSEGGAIWLDPEMMTPYSFYQFWLNVEDAEVIKLLKVFTFLPKEEIEELASEVESNPGARAAQKVLAAEVTRFVHGQDALDQAINASAALFGRGDITLLDAPTLQAAIDGVPVADAKMGDRLTDCFQKTALTSSFGDTKRNFEAGGLYINNQKVPALDAVITAGDLLADNILLLRKGKKNLAAIRVDTDIEEK